MTSTPLAPVSAPRVCPSSAPSSSGGGEVRGGPAWLRGLAPLVVLAAGLAAGAAGCARPQPTVVPEPPALAVPVAPPRLLAPLPEPELPAGEEAGAEAPATPRRPVRQPPRPRPDAPREGTKTETPADPAATPPAEAKPAEPSAPLRTPQTANDQQAERRIREVLGRATQALAQVNVGRLGGDARQQYESARRFVDQAGGALRAGNYMFASYLADKAEALARGLVGR